MDLPESVPQVELRVNGAQNIFYGSTARSMPREEATGNFVRSLNSLAMATGEASESLLFFNNVYFEMASISALQQALDRLLEQDYNFKDIDFFACKGEVEMAMCLSLKSKCQELWIGHQCLPFTPALAEALAKSASLDKLFFDQVTFDNKAKMERLGLCLCENSSITTLELTDTFLGDEGDESMVAFVKHLPGMSHLRHLSLGGNDFGEAGKQALVEVLEEGVHPLLELTLEGKPPSLQNYVNFLLWLKNIGGKRAISSCRRMEWIDLLSHFTNDEDPSTLYFTPLRSDLGRVVSSVDLLTHFTNDEDLSALYFTLRSDPGRFVNL
jgi:hypothetical protein